MPPGIFLVTGLHTKRRASSDHTTIKSARVGSDQAIPLRVPMPMTRKSLTLAPHQEPMRMSAHKTTMDEGNDVSPTKPIRPPDGRFKFVPKPLILVERMKVRRQILGSPSISALKHHPDTPEDAEPGKDTPESLEKSTATTVTMKNQTTPGRLPFRGSHSISVRYNMRSGAVAAFGGNFAIPQANRFSSTVISDASPSSTDTFVDNSPSCTKWSTKVQLLTEILPGFDMDKLDRPRISNFGLTAFVTSVLSGGTCQLTDTFGPAMTSTPPRSSQPRTNNPSSSITYSLFPINETPGLPDNFAIPSPTSRFGHPFNAAPDSYIVKLPNPRPTASLSRLNRSSIASTTSTAVSDSELRSDSCETMHASSAKATADSRRSPSRVISPTLVLDGVFAIPRASNLVSSRKSAHELLPTRKLTLRLHPPLSDATSTTRIIPPPAPTISRASFTRGSDSPRSRLARVLNNSTNQNVNMSGELKMPRMRKSCVPLFVTGVKASIDPVSQSEIEALREHGQGIDAGVGAGLGAFDSFIGFAPVGRVAKLRERWERGAVGLKK